MKSTTKALENRGMASEDNIFALSNLSLTGLITKLGMDDACVRSAAATNLRSFVDEAAEALLLQLLKEKCLYTRIAICECLELGNIETARKMTAYLGCIGNNQHKVLPDKVSAKKCFPLPRDLIARSLGRMDRSVFSALMEVLESNQTERISEVLDAVGYMVFYNHVLATKENCENIISIFSRQEGHQVIRWKTILCLSAFWCKESKDFLAEFANEQSIFGLEARRSLTIMEKRNNIKLSQ
jgi:hypothetical protein